MANNIELDAYPWNPSSPLCALLREPKLWTSAFNTDRSRRALKKAVKHAGRSGVIPLHDEDKLGELCVWMMENQKRRKLLDKILISHNAPPVYNLLWSHFYHDDADVNKTFPQEVICVSSNGRIFIDPLRFAKVLQQVGPKDEMLRSVAIFVSAFAMLQPEVSMELGTILATYSAEIAEKLRPFPNANRLASPLVEVNKDIVSDILESTQSEPDIQESVDKSQRTGDLPSPTITRQWLQVGEDLGCTFITVEANLRLVLVKAEGLMKDLSLHDHMGSMELLDELTTAVNKVHSAASDLDAWLDGCGSRIQGILSEENLVFPSQLIELLDASLKGRTTVSSMLFIANSVCDLAREVRRYHTEVGIENQSICARVKLLLADLTRPADLSISEDLPDDLVESLRIQQSLSNLEIRLSGERDAQLAGARQNVASSVREAISRLKFVPHDLKCDVESFQHRVSASKTLGEIRRLQILGGKVLERIANHAPKNSPELAAKLALESKCEPKSVVNVVSELVKRQRFEEAAFLLTLLESSFAPEEVDLDFELFIDLLLFSFAGLESRPQIGSQWCILFFQSAWLQSLRQSDIASSTLLTRIAAAFVLLYYRGEAANSVNLLYSLSLGELKFPSSLSNLAQLMEAIAEQRQLPLTTGDFQRQLNTKNEALRAFFRRQTNGAYVRQAAHGNAVADAERTQLFPQLEKAYSETLSFCERGQIMDADAVVDQIPAIAEAAFREKKLSTTESPYYKKQIFGQNHGYVPLLQELLADLVDGYRSLDSLNPTNKPLVPIDGFAATLQEQGKADDTRSLLWNVLAKGILEQKCGLKDIGEEIQNTLVLMLRTCPNAIVLVPDCLTQYCSHEGVGLNPSSALSEALRSLVEADEATGFDKLLQGGCLHHCLVVADHHNERRATEPSQKAYVEGLIAQRMSAIKDRCDKLFQSGGRVAVPQDVEQLLQDGRLGAVDRKLIEYDAQKRTAEESQRSDFHRRIDSIVKGIETLEQTIVDAGVEESLVRRTLELSGKALQEIKFARLQMRTGHEPDFPRFEQIFAALEYVVRNRARTFLELEGLLAIRVNMPEEPIASMAQPSELSIELDVSIIEAWQNLASLKSIQDNQQIQASRDWAVVAKEICRMSEMYHDIPQTLVSSYLKDYPFYRYQTRFYNPRSGWLDRPICLYLALKIDDWKDLAARLKAHLDQAADSLNIVIAPRGAEDLKKVLQFDSRRSSFVFIDAVAATSLSKGQQSGAHLRQLLHRTAEKLVHIGLFRTDGFVHRRKNLFVGREEALQQLAQQRASAIWGGRRIGKTSLLQALRDRIEGGAQRNEWETRIIYADVHGDNPDLSLACSIARSLNIDTPGSPEDLAQSLTNLAREKRVCLLIDEVDRYIEASREKFGPTRFPLARCLRGIAQSDRGDRFKLVYAGFKQLYYEVKIRPNSDTADPFKNFLEPVTKDFGDFTPEQVETMMRIAFTEMLGISYEVAVPRTVKQKTSGHPAFVQALGDRILARIDSRRFSQSSTAISVKDVDEVYSEDPESIGDHSAYIDYVYETLGWNLSHLGRAIMLAISIDIVWNKRSYEHVYLEREIAGLLREWTSDAPELSSVDFSNTLQFLIMTNMLTSKQKGQRIEYRVAYPSYIDFMERLGNLDRVAVDDSIRQYHQLEKGRIV